MGEVKKAGCPTSMQAAGLGRDHPCGPDRTERDASLRARRIPCLFATVYQRPQQPTTPLVKRVCRRPLPRPRPILGAYHGPSLARVGVVGLLKSGPSSSSGAQSEPGRNRVLGEKLSIQKVTTGTDFPRFRAAPR